MNVRAYLESFALVMPPMVFFKFGFARFFYYSDAVIILNIKYLVSLSVTKSKGA